MGGLMDSPRDDRKSYLPEDPQGIAGLPVAPVLNSSDIASLETAVPKDPPLRTTLAIASCTTSTSFLSAMAGQSVLLMLPVIGRDLNISQENLTWILNSYVLSYGCLLLLSGRIADIISRKYTFILGMSLFSVFSLSCGLVRNSQSIPFFILRALAGLGASLAAPASIGIIAENHPEGRRRSIMYAAYGAGNPVGAAVGVLLGGSLADSGSHGWRTAFYITCGIGVIPVVAAFWAVPSRRPDPNADRRIDLIGAVLSTAGLVMLLYVFTSGPTAAKGFATPAIIAMLVVSVCLLAIFTYWEWYIENRLKRPPLLKLALFTRGKGKLSVVYGFIFFNFASFSGYFLLTDLYYQQVLHLKPSQTMLRFLPTSVSGLACNILIAFLVPHITGQILLCVGALMTAIAPLLYAVIEPGAIFWTNEFWGMILCVAGADFGVAVGLIFVSKLSLSSEHSSAGGLFQTALQVGNAFGTAIATLVYTSIAQQKVDQLTEPVEVVAGHGEYPPDALLSGLKIGFWTSCGLALGAFLLSAVFLRGMGTVESKRVATKTDRESMGEGNITNSALPDHNHIAHQDGGEQAQANRR